MRVLKLRTRQSLYVLSFPFAFTEETTKTTTRTFFVLKKFSQEAVTRRTTVMIAEIVPVAIAVAVTVTVTATAGTVMNLLQNFINFSKLPFPF